MNLNLSTWALAGSSRRLEREAGRYVEMMWLTGRLAPDHKTIADPRSWPTPDVIFN